MESGSVHSCPGTVEKLFQDFKGRRAGIIKALTIEVDEFYDRCDPEKGNLCLFGYPDGSWDVNRPADEVPPELPEPLLGINFAREEMQRYEWLSLVAAHSDAWLMAVSSYIGARSGFRKNERKRLFGMINELPTIYEVTVSNIEKQTKDSKFVVPNNNGNNHRGCKNKSSGQQLAEIQSQLHLLTNQHKQTLQELVKVKAELAELKTQLKQRDDELAQVPIAQNGKEMPTYVQMKNLMKSIKSEMMGKDEEIRRLSQLLQSSQEKGRGMPSRPS